MANIAEALFHTGYDQIAFFPEDFEGWAASLSKESGDCLCGKSCYCCDPISITREVAEFLLENHSDWFTVTND